MSEAVKLETLLQAAWRLVAETEPDEEGMRNPPSVEAVDVLMAALPPRPERVISKDKQELPF